MELAFNTIDGTRTSSLIFAEGTGNQHKNILELIRKYNSDLEEFGPLAFETRKGKALPQGGFAKSTEFALLNEQQASLLMTYMKNTEVVREFKKNLVRAFYELSSLMLGHYDHKSDLQRIRKFEGEVRMMGLARMAAERAFKKEQRIQDKAFSLLCKKTIGYCPYDLIGLPMELNSEESGPDLGSFLSECISQDEDGVVSYREIYAAYVNWCREKGIKSPVKARQLNIFLGSRFSQHRTSGSRGFRGISLVGEG